MEIYYPSLEAIEQVTAQLQNKVCCHCQTKGQLVSHGRVYKKSSAGQPTRWVGKRVYCSPRYGRSGCGRTMQLYLATALVYLHVARTAVVDFVNALYRGLRIELAYRLATGARDTRSAFRWLDKLFTMGPVFRAALAQPPLDASPPQALNRANHRRGFIVSTFRGLITQFGTPLCAAFQSACQRSFIRL